MTLRRDSISDFAVRFDLPEEAITELQSLVDELVEDEAGGRSALPTSVAALGPADADPFELPHQRYEDLGLLGLGGMGEVRRVRDRQLRRTLAMKLLHGEQGSLLARFVAEAQATAQLQHPGIVPVHELGRLSDGRVYFTMREVRGRTLSDVIDELHAQYIAYLDDLVARGREREALEHAPRERAGGGGEQGAMIYGRADDGRFFLRPDADGDLWLPEFPVCLITWRSACAYLDWLSERTARPWRLPGELEWEKAARGVDGRFYPWGDFVDTSWVCADEVSPAPIGSFPVDESPWGVRHTAGNMQDLCAEPFEPGGQVRNRCVVLPEAVSEAGALLVIRGGAWSGALALARSAQRFRDPPTRSSLVGFRGVFRPGDRLRGT